MIVGACGSTDPIESACTATDPDPPVEPTTACAEPPATGCKRFYLPLLGNQFPCKVCGKLTTCTEKTELKAPSDPYVYDPDEAQVHHVARATDLRGCKWGSNANKNAVVISGKLNKLLKNKYPSATEVNWVNKVPAYTP
jgi:hypothetical protein